MPRDMKSPLQILLMVFILSEVPLLHGETPAFQVLEYPFSPRAMAMGDTRAVNVTPSLEAAGNPAALTFTSDLQGKVGLVNHLVDIKGYSAIGVLPLENHRISGEMVYFDYGLFDRTDAFGNPTGSFGFHELSLQMAYAYSITDRWRLGTRAGWVQRVADNTTSGQGILNFGALYHLAEDSLTVGVLVSNLAVDEGSDELPTAIRVGTSKILTYLPLRLNLETDYRLADNWLLALGGEILLHPQFTLRLGINSNRFDLHTGVSASDFLAGVSGGFFVEWMGLQVEMAAQSFGAAGFISQAALAYHF